MTEIERDETGRPVGDGYYILELINDPLNLKDRQNSQYYETTTVQLHFRDYPGGFTMPGTQYHDGHTSPDAFVGRHRDGYMVFYPWHNIAYMEMRPNSPEVAKAFKEWQEQQ